MRPLTCDDLEALPLLITVRLALSLVSGASAAVADPGNSEYLLMTQRHGWALMRILMEDSTLEQLMRRNEDVQRSYSR